MTSEYEVQPITYISFTDVCYERIRNDVLSGRIDWGERLDVVGLAERYGVSRSPVVKAIDRLAHEGIVEILPNKGSFVRTPEERDVIEATEVRIALELMACELAFQKNRARLLPALDKNEGPIRQYTDSGEPIPFDVFLSYDRSFHQIFALMSDNHRLLDLFEVNRNQIELFRTKTYDMDNTERALTLHHSIIADLNADRLDNALRDLRKHIEEVRQDIIKSLKNPNR